MYFIISTKIEYTIDFIIIFLIRRVSELFFKKL